MTTNRSRRVVIEEVKPQVDGGRFPVKRVVGERVVVEADVFADGHDLLSCVLLYRQEVAKTWIELPMVPLVKDRWRAEFTVREPGSYFYTVMGWIDRFKTWLRDLQKKVEAQQEVTVEILVGAGLVKEASRRASGADRKQLKLWASTLEARSDYEGRLRLALSQELSDLMTAYPDRRLATTYEKELGVVVDRVKARFSTWYEMFPRSSVSRSGQHGTFKDCEARLPYIASMGFDVLYLPPIHPIGRANRKGKNNLAAAGPEDPGSPWAIGSEEGGHKAVHPLLGTLEDFSRFVVRAQEHGLEVALDLAFQCSPDHPYAREHPEWFRQRPDGTVQYAENPPKKYEDIVPLDFETDDQVALWDELKSIVLFWIGKGIRIFRVDNPHTKPFSFWEWLIRAVKRDHPEVIFLAEAFTRPKVMYRLAKLGFTQSYTYFAWRNTRWELTQYFTELAQTEVREYFRPSLWTNTPDILTEYLQSGGRPAFMTRLVLAATLGASYGIFGPTFELCENRPRHPGTEEYLDSEKYEVRYWDLERPDSFKDFIARVNWIRRNSPALQSDWTLRFHPVDNDQLLCYSKQSEDGTEVMVMVVNLDPHYTQSGWVQLRLEDLGIDPMEPYEVHDLLREARYLWRGPRNYVELNPHQAPAHIFRVQRQLRAERGPAPA